MGPLRKHFFGDLYKTGRYKPKHTELFDKEAAKRVRDNGWLAKTFEAARPKDLKEESPGVYSFDLFTPEFCQLLLEEIEHAEATARNDLERPNGMNRYGIVLNQLGLEPLITSLLEDHLLPVQSSLFPVEGEQADDHHCFIVRYKAGEDLGLDMHEDDSDVTLNVCLGKEFTAATLSFCGMCTDKDHRNLRITYNHKPGRAVLHLGRHRHGADNIESGERVNFILWTTNAKYRKSELYNLHRMRSAEASPPDPICLSYTHDRDYTQYLPKPEKKDALARGVMLDVVERRHALYQRPVHDLARPIEEINELPCVCLFMEGLPREAQGRLFGIMMEVANEVRGRSPQPSVLFFTAVQPVGAVPQVRAICGLEHSPGLAVLDIDKGQCHVYKDGDPFEPAEMSHAELQLFVDNFIRGAVPGRPVRDPDAPRNAQEEEEKKQQTPAPLAEAKAEAAVTAANAGADAAAAALSTEGQELPAAAPEADPPRQATEQVSDEKSQRGGGCEVQ